MAFSHSALAAVRDMIARYSDNSSDSDILPELLSDSDSSDSGSGNFLKIDRRGTLALKHIGLRYHRETNTCTTLRERLRATPIAKKTGGYLSDSLNLPPLPPPQDPPPPLLPISTQTDSALAAPYPITPSVRTVRSPGDRRTCSLCYGRWHTETNCPLHALSGGMFQTTTCTRPNCQDPMCNGRWQTDDDMHSAPALMFLCPHCGREAVDLPIKPGQPHPEYGCPLHGPDVELIERAVGSSPKRARKG